MDTLIFLLKVFLASLALSIAIKYFAPLLSIAPTFTNALVAVLLPPFIITIVLLIALPSKESANS